MIGTRLAHFEITAKLGEGGMGEVWLADDTKLGRRVALKVLPADVAGDAERMARFEREAKVLASLNHPGIAHLYGLESIASGTDADAGRTTFLVMELVEGEDLTDRIARGPIPVDEAVRISLQIAEALEAAHEQGIVHRDLKPANIKLRPDGTVKVLDFGLAKTWDTKDGDGSLSMSPTLTQNATAAGVILGTAAYMSPEQAAGVAADRRADIWAFGVVLWEMLTGKKLFEGETVSHVLASVIKDDIDMESLPDETPGHVRRLIVRCLRKKPRERLQAIGDARLVLEDVAAGRIEESPEGAAPEGAALRRWPIPAAAALVAGLLLGAVAMNLLGGRDDTGAPETPPRQFVLDYGDLRESRPEISPDGHRVAYAKDNRIWVRDLRRLETIPIPGTERGTTPVWSPDGEWLAFDRAGEGLWKIRLDGSGATRLASENPGATAGGMVWLDDGRILFVTGRSAVMQVNERGGDVVEFSPVLEGEADFHYLAELPDGKGFLTIPHRGDTFDSIDVIFPDGGRREVLKLEGYPLGPAVYSPTGHLVFVRYPVGLWAVPFSLDELATTGDPFPVANRVITASSIRNGSLAYATRLPPVESELVLLNRSGRVEQTLGDPIVGIYPAPAMSPDGRTVVAPVYGSQGSDLWSFGLDGSPARRLTFEERNVTTHPAWSSDGTKIYYTANDRWDDVKISWIPSGGGREPEDVVKGSWPPVFTRDGTTMVYGNWSAGFNWNLWMRAVDEPGEGTPLLDDPGWEIYPSLSPDDRYLAYSHEGKIYVRAFPGMEGPWQVGEGEVPVWSPVGDRLYFTNGDDMMEAVFRAGPEPRFSSPAKLFSFAHAPSESGVPPTFAVTPDGERFVMVRTLEPPPGIVVMQNWLETLE
jgi:serine/threonine-protein kinase